MCSVLRPNHSYRLHAHGVTPSTSSDLWMPVIHSCLTFIPCSAATRLQCCPRPASHPHRLGTDTVCCGTFAPFCIAVCGSLAPPSVGPAPMLLGACGCTEGSAGVTGNIKLEVGLVGCPGFPGRAVLHTPPPLVHTQAHTHAPRLPAGPLPHRVSDSVAHTQVASRALYQIGTSPCQG